VCVKRDPHSAKEVAGEASSAGSAGGEKEEDDNKTRLSGLPVISLMAAGLSEREAVDAVGCLSETYRYKTHRFFRYLKDVEDMQLSIRGEVQTEYKGFIQNMKKNKPVIRDTKSYIRAIRKLMEVVLPRLSSKCEDTNGPREERKAESIAAVEAAKEEVEEPQLEPAPKWTREPARKRRALFHPSSRWEGCGAGGWRDRPDRGIGGCGIGA